jgi:DNA-binding beta-propeller fold protein YncE
MRLKATQICLAAALLLVLGASGAAAETRYLRSFGSPGSGAGQLSNPAGVAVNNASGDVYVADSANNRIVQFDSDGDFIRTWGKDVNQTTPGDVCPINPGDVCQAGRADAAAGAFKDPNGIAVDNSPGPANGSLYVQDADNFRVQRFDASGQFVLMWGRNVNINTGGDVCTAASGHACKVGVASSGSPSPPGHFAVPPPYVSQSLALDGAGNVYVGDTEAEPNPRVQKFDSSGAFLGQIAAGRNVFSTGGFISLSSLAVNSTGDAFIVDGSRVLQYDSADFTAGGEDASWDRVFDPVSGDLGPDREHPQAVAIDPHNDYLFVVDRRSHGCASGPGPARIREFHPSGQEVDCSAPSIAIDGLEVEGMAVSSSQRLYLADSDQDRIHAFQTPVATPPTVEGERAVEITSTSARIDVQVAANLDDTSFHVQYGTAGPCSANPCASTNESQSIGASVFPKAAVDQLNGLEAATTYHYRVVATNDEGTTPGTDHSFRTFAEPIFDPSCPNHLARQQTKASLLLDCRAYELVSAPNTGGYNVASDLVAGQQSLAGYPQAQDRALYSIHNGAVPGVEGNPTNRGADPYLAVRDAENERWETTYVGLPANNPNATSPFGSPLLGADSSLSSFAFGGIDICNPCFSDGSTNVPLRLPDKSLIQGMAGSSNPAPANPEGEVRKPLSADGSHFLFGSRLQFEPSGNSNGTDLTIYDRDLEAGTTQVVSTLPDGSTIAAGTGVAALDVSEDGSRILIGRLVRTDTSGNRYFDLFMHTGVSPNSVEIVDSANGAIYAGMSSDGSEVYFTTPDALATAADQDTDTSADLYRADVGSSSSTLIRVSTGTSGTGDTNSCDPTANSQNPANWNVLRGGPTDCSAVAIAGGGGVGADPGGAVYFLSPEQLQSGEGAPNAPNLYRATPGDTPTYVTTLESKLGFGAFNRATGIATDPSSGDVYVIDIVSGAGNSRVRKFDSEGNPVNFTTGPDTGTNALRGADAPCTAFNFNFFGALPVQLAVDPTSGNLYVPNHGAGAIGVFDSSGDCLAQFAVPSPIGVALHPTSGNLYVPTGNSIRVLTPAGALVSDFSVAAQSSGPRAVAVDSSGNFYVANGRTAAKYNPSGAFLRVIDPNPSFGVAVDDEDNVYVNEGTRVIKLGPGGSPQLASTPEGALAGSVGLALGPGGVYATNSSTSIRRFTQGLEANPVKDSALVTGALADAELRDTSAFQTNPSGDHALFPSAEPLTGEDTGGRLQAFHYDALTEDLLCISCDPTAATPPTSDARLAQNGLSLTDDGRAFFDTAERLVQRDSNSRRDVYEYSDGAVELISTGISAFDSSLLSVTANGTDAFFFTRERLVEADRNANLVKLYTAREEGGFFVIPPPPDCVASDECHGAGSQAAPPASIGTLTPNQLKPNPPAPRCRRGKVRRRGRCVNRKSKRQGKQRAAGAKRGGRR